MLIHILKSNLVESHMARNFTFETLCPGDGKLISNQGLYNTGAMYLHGCLHGL